MQVRPLTPEGLVDRLAGLLAAQRPGEHLRVALDGAPPTEPERLADALVGPLRAQGRPALRVSARAFLRPASLRFEHGREDPDAYYEDWLDVAALDREVLSPLAPGGRGRYLPTLWDPVTDRATRAEYATAPPGAVLLLDGSLLLGRWLDLDVTVHLAVRPATLARRLPPDERWTLPAYERYRQEAEPEESADVVVRVDDPRHPALVERSGEELPG
ncbi:nucleoside/nucleotide kinase family protein [Motilibacter deserti]|uniref:Uridine kinase n=1 Tax=Motilibacter deserti TaxID=2714956 RepID=A0ABX0GTA0_9ACTN|nr:uridine kinase [Motilibacter deserti]NHC13750.1 uridine kinase [Motilibacter deserti]